MMMSEVTAANIRDSLPPKLAERLEHIEWFAELDSTSSYLLAAPRPEVNQWRVAIADEQTAGRGRGANQWHSAPGAGLWMSGAYTLASTPDSLGGITLAIGAAVAETLTSLGVSDIRLKWPNDLIVDDRKLGGILLDSSPTAAGGMSIVCGLGINSRLPAAQVLNEVIEASAALFPIDLESVLTDVPTNEALAATMLESMVRTLDRFESDGFAPFIPRWSAFDWLAGRRVVVQGNDQLTGIAEGISEQGELIVREGDTVHYVISGSVRPEPGQESVA